MAAGSNMSHALAGLLSSYGVTASSAERQSIEDTTYEFLHDRGLSGCVVRDLRWGVLTIVCPPHTAALVSFETTKLDAVLSASHSETYREVRVRVARPGEL